MVNLQILNKIYWKRQNLVNYIADHFVCLSLVWHNQFKTYLSEGNYRIIDFILRFNIWFYLWETKIVDIIYFDLIILNDYRHTLWLTLVLTSDWLTKSYHEAPSHNYTPCNISCSVFSKTKPQSCWISTQNHCHHPTDVNNQPTPAISSTLNTDRKWLPNRVRPRSW